MTDISIDIEESGDRTWVQDNASSGTVTIGFHTAPYLALSSGNAQRFELDDEAAADLGRSLLYAYLDLLQSKESPRLQSAFADWWRSRADCDVATGTVQLRPEYKSADGITRFSMSGRGLTENRRIKFDTGDGGHSFVAVQSTSKSLKLRRKDYRSGCKLSTFFNPSENRYQCVVEPCISLGTGDGFTTRYPRGELREEILRVCSQTIESVLSDLDEYLSTVGGRSSQVKDRVNEAVRQYLESKHFSASQMRSYRIYGDQTGQEVHIITPKAHQIDSSMHEDTALRDPHAFIHHVYDGDDDDEEEEESNTKLMLLKAIDQAHTLRPIITVSLAAWSATLLGVVQALNEKLLSSGFRFDKVDDTSTVDFHTSSRVKPVATSNALKSGADGEVHRGSLSVDEAHSGGSEIEVTVTGTHHFSGQTANQEVQVTVPVVGSQVESANRARSATREDPTVITMSLRDRN